MRLIDRDALPKYTGYALSASEVAMAVENAPTIDAVPVVHGWWIRNDNGTWSCNRCHSWIPDEQHYYAQYCLYCGSKMDGGRKERQC